MCCPRSSLGPQEAPEPSVAESPPRLRGNFVAGPTSPEKHSDLAIGAATDLIETKVRYVYVLAELARPSAALELPCSVLRNPIGSDEERNLVEALFVGPRTACLESKGFVCGNVASDRVRERNAWRPVETAERERLPPAVCLRPPTQCSCTVDPVDL